VLTRDKKTRALRERKLHQRRCIIALW